MIGFPVHSKVADTFTELIELTFETNKLPIDKDIFGRNETKGDTIKSRTMSLLE